MVGMQCPIHHTARTDKVVMATDSGNSEVSYPDKKKKNGTKERWGHFALYTLRRGVR